MARRDLAAVALAVIGAAISAHLAAYQLDWIASVWDPIFGLRSSAAVLHSGFSEALPVPDGAVGVVAYVVEAVLATIVSIQRRRRLRVLYGLLVAGTALAGLGLVVLQVTVIGHLCVLCMASAATSWAIAAVALPDAVHDARMLRSTR